MNPRIDSTKQLQKIVDRMSARAPIQGFAHAFVHALLMVGLGCSIFVFWQHDVRLAVVLTIPFAILYVAILVTCHDCVHSTYTGIKSFDYVWARTWSLFVFWPYCLYKELHLLHHEMLGQDYADPERFTYLRSEYEKSSQIKRWYIRNQWFLNIFVLGGIGFYFNLWRRGHRLKAQYSQLESAMKADMIGIICSLVSQMIFVSYFSLWAEYLLSILIMERIIGGFTQLRALTEHYGLWEGRNSNIHVRLALSSRNIKCGWFMRWLFNDLCFHSIHHLFPQIPWYRLGEAHLSIPSSVEGLNDRVVAPKDSYTKVMVDGVRSWRLLS